MLLYSKIRLFFQICYLIIGLKGSERLTLYVDVLFAINFSMDFLALFISSMILHKKATKIRMIISSLLGATFGVIEVLSTLNWAWSLIFSLTVSILMCIIAYKEKYFKRLIFTLITFWIVSASLGGAMSFLYSVLNKVLSSVIKSFSPSISYNGARFFIIVSLTAIVGIVFSRIFSKKKDVKSTEITVLIDKIEYKIKALCDSGNMLTEPISSRAVILVCEKTPLGKKIKEIDNRFKRYIPYSGVDSGGILMGYVPSEIYIGDNLVDAIIATLKKDSFAGYDGLVPITLM